MYLRPRDKIFSKIFRYFWWVAFDFNIFAQILFSFISNSHISTLEILIFCCIWYFILLWQIHVFSDYFDWIFFTNISIPSCGLPHIYFHIYASLCNFAFMYQLWRICMCLCVLAYTPCLFSHLCLNLCIHLWRLLYVSVQPIPSIVPLKWAAKSLPMVCVTE